MGTMMGKEAMTAVVCAQLHHREKRHKRYHNVTASGASGATAAHRASKHTRSRLSFPFRSRLVLLHEARVAPSSYEAGRQGPLSANAGSRAADRSHIAPSEDFRGKTSHRHLAYESRETPSTSLEQQRSATVSLSQPQPWALHQLGPFNLTTICST
jgi:hypothetical protein